MDQIATKFSPGSTNSTLDSSTYATERARIMLGSYRKGEANDPKIYGATVAAILARYSRQVIDAVTSPVSGLPVRTDFMPTPREVKEACEREAQRAERIERYSAMKPIERPLLADPLRGRERPNLFVSVDNPRYRQMVERHEKDEKSLCHFEQRECQDGETRHGIWVPLYWFGVSG